MSGGSGIEQVTIGGAAISEKNQRQVLTELTIQHPDQPLHKRCVLEWRAAQRLLSDYPELATLPAGIGVLSSQRPPVTRVNKYLGSVPRGIGADGVEAVQYLAAAKADGRSEPFEAINEWFASLGVQIDVDLHREDFATTASRPGGSGVNIADAGAGIAQILPLVIALRVVPEADRPRLFIIEQPEIDLHPHAHARVAELLLEAASKEDGPRMLVETHSDALVLRIRREIAAERLPRMSHTSRRRKRRPRASKIFCAISRRERSGYRSSSGTSGGRRETSSTCSTASIEAIP